MNKQQHKALFEQADRQHAPTINEAVPVSIAGDAGGPRREFPALKTIDREEFLRRIARRDSYISGSVWTDVGAVDGSAYWGPGGKLLAVSIELPMYGPEYWAPILQEGAVEDNKRKLRKYYAGYQVGVSDKIRNFRTTKTSQTNDDWWRGYTDAWSGKSPEVKSPLEFLESGSLAPTIAHLMKTHHPTSYELMARYGMSLAQAEKLTRVVDVQAFGPWGKGYDWAVDQVTKILSTIDRNESSSDVSSQFKAAAAALLAKSTGTGQDDLHYRAYLRAVQDGQPTDHLVQQFAGSKKARQDIIDLFGSGKLESLSVDGRKNPQSTGIATEATEDLIKSKSPSEAEKLFVQKDKDSWFALLHKDGMYYAVDHDQWVSLKGKGYRVVHFQAEKAKGGMGDAGMDYGYSLGKLHESGEVDLDEKGLPKGEYWRQQGKTPWGSTPKQKKDKERHRQGKASAGKTRKLDALLKNIRKEDSRHYSNLVEAGDPNEIFGLETSSITGQLTYVGKGGSTAIELAMRDASRGGGPLYLVSGVQDLQQAREEIKKGKGAKTKYKNVFVYGVKAHSFVEYQPHPEAVRESRYSSYEITKTDLIGRGPWMIKLTKPDGNFETSFHKTKEDAEKWAQSYMSMSETYIAPIRVNTKEDASLVVDRARRL